jgi:predicted nucleic acid-binding Zn ribbon protein
MNERIRQTLPKQNQKCARLECEVVFIVDDPRQKFCCRSCSGKVNNLGRFKPKKPCPVCGNPIANRRRKYCSSLCQYALQNRKNHSKLMLEIANRQTTIVLSEVAIELLGLEARRQRVFAEQGFACNGCGLTEWRGQPIGLQLEHKDGNRDNNVRENLEGLCGNCHCQTPTWCGRNNSRRVSDDEMRDAIRQTSSIRKALVSLGMAPKGGNYKRIKRIDNEMKSAGEVLPPFTRA